MLELHGTRSRFKTWLSAYWWLQERTRKSCRYLNTVVLEATRVALLHIALLQ